MKVVIYLVYLTFILYSCTPINKQHGYLMEDMLSSSGEMTQFVPGTTSKNDVFLILGSPSIKISDINNIWIYLISLKTQNIFENDDIVFQSIYRFEFNNKGVLISKNTYNKENFTEIAFSDEKTRVIADSYGLADQLYDSFTRGQ